MVRDSGDNLYGAGGTLFILGANGILTISHRLQQGADGLFRDPTGNLYATIADRGFANCGPAPGYGVVFEFKVAASRSSASILPGG